MATTKRRTNRPKRPSRTGRTGRQQQVNSQRVNALRLAILRAMPPIRVAIPGPSHVVTAAYAARLRTIVDRSWAIVQRTLQPALDRQVALQTQVADAKRKKPQNPDQPDLPIDIEASLATMAGQLDAYAVSIPATAIAASAANAVQAQAMATTLRISRTLGLRAVDNGTQLADLRDVWVKNNATLIVSQPRAIADRVQTKVQAMVEAGSRWETISAQVQAEHGIGQRRADLIARDQVSKYNGALNEANQRSVGITHYEWRGAMDARERPEHVALQGLVFSWDKPSPLGHPGEPIQCRCVASPVTSQQQIDKATTQPEVTQAWLTQRTIELGPKARDVGKTPDQIEAIARKSVAGQIAQAQNRQRILGSSKALQSLIVPPAPAAPVVPPWQSPTPPAGTISLATSTGDERAAFYIAEADRFRALLNKTPNDLAAAMAEFTQASGGPAKTADEWLSFTTNVAKGKTKGDVAARDWAKASAPLWSRQAVHAYGLDELAARRTTFAYKARRAYCMAARHAGAQTLINSGSGDIGTQLHEGGHWFENRTASKWGAPPGDVAAFYGAKTSIMQRAAVEFRDRRTAGEKLTSLRTLTGSSGYARGEKAKGDQFISPYVGKEYAGNAYTEVVSMGVEMFAGPIRAATFVRSDPEHAGLILSILQGKIAE